MNRRWLRTLGLGLLLVALLACGTFPGGPTPTPSPTPTETAPAPTLPSPTPTVETAPGGAGDTPTPELPTPCPQLELEIDFQQIQSMPEAGIHSEIQASGEIALSVDTATDPPTVRGEGELPISGGGQVGECSWTASGTLAYRLEGEIVPGPTGSLEVHLGGERRMNLIMVGGECGGGGGAPFEPLAETVFPYEDGATQEWTWSFPAGGVEGSSTWTLHILCRP